MYIVLKIHCFKAVSFMHSAKELHIQVCFACNMFCGYSLNKKVLLVHEKFHLESLQRE